VTGLDAPANPFGGRITPERTFAAVSLPMSRIKDVRAATGVKVNDVLLALVGGALRRYLDRRATRPEASLVANVAMSTRSGDDGADAGNKIGVLFARLGTHLDDPAERLRCVAADTVAAKAINQRLGQGGDIDMAALGPPVVISALARLYAGIGLQDYLKVLGNVGVSNVPGPPVKLFVCGTGLRGIFVMGPLMLNSLINFTAVSYRGQLDVGIVSSPSIVAQPSELAADLTSALDELWRATGRGA
jgi:WS/DGAT/MGAT family acyltransferase